MYQQARLLYELCLSDGRGRFTSRCKRLVDSPKTCLVGQLNTFILPTKRDAIYTDFSWKPTRIDTLALLGRVMPYVVGRLFRSVSSLPFTHEEFAIYSRRVCHLLTKIWRFPNEKFAKFSGDVWGVDVCRRVEASVWGDISTTRRCCCRSFVSSIGGRRRGCRPCRRRGS